MRPKDTWFNGLRAISSSPVGGLRPGTTLGESEGGLQTALPSGYTHGEALRGVPERRRPHARRPHQAADLARNGNSRLSAENHDAISETFMVGSSAHGGTTRGGRDEPRKLRRELLRPILFFESERVASMNKRRAVRSENLRLALAQEAARVMAEHGIRELPGGKAQGSRTLRSRRQRGVAQEYRDRGGARQYQRLFAADSHAESLLTQRHAALRAMRCLSDFAPRLVGSVLSGTATPHCDVQLHLLRRPGRGGHDQSDGPLDSARSDRAPREDERRAGACLSGRAFHD